MTDPIQLPIFNGDPDTEYPEEGMLAWDSAWNVPLVYKDGHWVSFMGVTAINYGPSLYKNDFLARSVPQNADGEVLIPLGYDPTGHKLNYFSVDGDAPAEGLGFKEFFNMSNSGSKAINTVLFDRPSHGMPWKPSTVLSETILTSSTNKFEFDLAAWQTANPTIPLGGLAGQQYYTITLELLARSTASTNFDDLKLSTRWYSSKVSTEGRQDLYARNAASYVAESADNFVAVVPGANTSSGTFATVRSSISMGVSHAGGGGGAPIKTEFQCANGTANVAVGSRFQMVEYEWAGGGTVFGVPNWFKMNLDQGDFEAGSTFRVIISPYYGEIL